MSRRTTAAAPAAGRVRLSRVDYARGIAIFLVVVGHVIGPLAIALEKTEWSELLYSLHLRTTFRMPALFLIAGIFAARSIRKGPRKFLTDRVGYLLYPYVLWNIIMVAAYFVGGWVTQLSGVQVVNRPPPLEGLLWMFWEPQMNWFLYALFVALSIYALLHHLRTPLWATLAGSFALYIAARLGLLDAVPLASEVGKRFFFLIAGAAIGNLLLVEGNRQRWWTPLPALLVSAGLLLWLSSLPVMQTMQPEIDAVAGIVSEGSDLVLRAQQLPIRLAIAVTGITALWSLAMILERLRGPKLVEYWGRISLEIYVVSTFGIVAATVLLHRVLHLEQPLILMAGGIFAGIALPMVVVWLTRVTGFKYLFRWGRASLTESTALGSPTAPASR